MIGATEGGSHDDERNDPLEREVAEHRKVSHDMLALQQILLRTDASWSVDVSSK
jgi:hypothetical protein